MCTLLVATLWLSTGEIKRYTIDWCYTPALCEASRDLLNARNDMGARLVWRCEEET